MRVLLVDDADELRVLMRAALEASGSFEVVAEAENGRDAVVAAERDQPDLVVLDVSMPIQNGMETLPKILAVAPGAKVVMLSGLEPRRLADMAFARGAVAYLEKGLDPDELVGLLLAVAQTA
jgi:DNA-binding NarL/FixJ family response regulator